MAARSLDRVVLVGHCGADAGMLRSAVSRALPNVEVSHADRPDQLDADGASLLLVNRVLPGGWGVSSGVELIRQLEQRSERDDNRPAAMLVSNFADAQREAEEAGALPGFGKSDLGRPETAEKLRRAAEGRAATE